MKWYQNSLTEHRESANEKQNDSSNYSEFEKNIDDIFNRYLKSYESINDNHRKNRKNYDRR